MKQLFVPLVLAICPAVSALGPDRPREERFGIHFQATVATQAHPSFSAKYSGPNSMKPDGESATSVVMDLFAALRLWRGAEIYLQPELSGGRGLSSTLGVAAFPSGEVYRVGNPTPVVSAARLGRSGTGSSSWASRITGSRSRGRSRWA